jgi:hypothetical protein
MHQKLTKHGEFRMKNNQLPTKSPVELKGNSNALPKFTPQRIQAGSRPGTFGHGKKTAQNRN